MNNLSANQLAKDQEITDTPNFTRATLILTAWIATLLLSKLPLVIARDIFGTDISWIMPAWIGTAALLFIATYIWQSLKPLRAYFSILGIIWLMTFFAPLVNQTAIWQNLFSGRSEMVALLGDRVFLILEAFILIAALLLMGAKRQDIFLTLGDLKAPLGGQASATRRRYLTWPVLGTVISLLLGGLFLLFLISQNPTALSNPALVLPWLPLILLNAGLNAFGEEVLFRGAPLGILLPAIGPKHALWLTSLWFGLGHYYGGIPSGPVGLIQSGLLALLMGKAMLDTRGMGWSWIIHVTIDTAIYTFLALTAVAAV